MGSEIEARARSTSKSAISREFVERARTAPQELLCRRLDELELAVLVIEGIELDEASHLACLVEGSALVARNLEDPLSFRCLPQVHGAALDALAYARGQLETELNAAQGNPLVDVEGDRIVSVGNFDVLPLAAALDFLRIALAPVLTCANERMVKLLQAPLPGFRKACRSAPGAPRTP